MIDLWVQNVKLIKLNYQGELFMKIKLLHYYFLLFIFHAGLTDKVGGVIVLLWMILLKRFQRTITLTVLVPAL